MGRKNRRRGGRELDQDFVREILTGKQTIHCFKPVSRPEGMRVEAVIVEGPIIESAADKACRWAGLVCDRIIAELDEELRRNEHVRSR